MNPIRWYVLSVNPEPWAVGPLDLIRKSGKLAPTMGRNQQLHAYKEAIRGELESRYPSDQTSVLEPNYAIDFFFWRYRAEYRGENKDTVKKNSADATNMQKATEDALQGILIDNDRNVLRVSSTVMAQGVDVAPAVVFRIQWGLPAKAIIETAMDYIPEDLMQHMLDFSYMKAPDANNWPPR